MNVLTDAGELIPDDQTLTFQESYASAKTGLEGSRTTQNAYRFLAENIESAKAVYEQEGMSIVDALNMDAGWKKIDPNGSFFQQNPEAIALLDAVQKGTRDLSNLIERLA